MDFCLRDSEAEQRALQFLHIHCSNVDSYSPAPESNKQNPPDRTLDLPFFFCYKHITSLKSLLSRAPSESLLYWFQCNFAAMFDLNYWLREFPLSVFANCFELRCEPQQLMLLYYKICPCCFWQYISFFFKFEFTYEVFLAAEQIRIMFPKVMLVNHEMQALSWQAGKQAI